MLLDDLIVLNNILINDDCLEVMKQIPDNSIDCIICDLPYGTTKCKWDILIPFDKLWEQYKRIRKEGCPIILFGTEPFSSYLRLSNIKEFKYDWVWKKSKSGSAFTAKYRPVNKHEMISVFGKGVINYFPQKTEGTPYSRNHLLSEADINNHKIGFNKKVVKTDNDGFRYPITVQEFQQKWRRQDQVHPTQKPVELMEYLVKTYTREQAIVLDNCMGSGSAGVACRNLNRKFIGIEKEKEYFEIAEKRINHQDIRKTLF